MEGWGGWWLVCFHFLCLSLSHTLSSLFMLATPFFFSLHPSRLRLSSLPGLIMNCLCFPSHFPLCPLVWSPLLMLRLTLFLHPCVLFRQTADHEWPSPGPSPPRLCSSWHSGYFNFHQCRTSSFSPPPSSFLLHSPFFHPLLPSLPFSPHHWTILSGLWWCSYPFNMLTLMW